MRDWIFIFTSSDGALTGAQIHWMLLILFLFEIVMNNVERSSAVHWETLTNRERERLATSTRLFNSWLFFIFHSFILTVKSINEPSCFIVSKVSFPSKSSDILCLGVSCLAWSGISVSDNCRSKDYTNVSNA